LDRPRRYFAVVKDKWRRTEQKSGFRVNKLVDINFRKSVAFPNSVLVRRKRREEKKRRFWRKGARPFPGSRNREIDVPMAFA